MNLKSSKIDLGIIISVIGLTLVLFAIPEWAQAADFKQGMEGIRNALSQTVLPLLAVIGLVIAAFSFMTGNPNAKQHAIYALLGAGLGFGAQAIIDFVKTSVNSGL